MDTTLANILSDTSLDQPSRLLYAVLHACTNGSGAGEMAVDEALTRLGASNVAYLRRLRSQLLAAGYLDSHVTDGTLHWTLLAVERAPQARSEATSAPVGRAADAPSAPV